MDESEKNYDRLEQLCLCECSNGLSLQYLPYTQQATRFTCTKDALTHSKLLLTVSCSMIASFVLYKYYVWPLHFEYHLTTSANWHLEVDCGVIYRKFVLLVETASNEIHFLRNKSSNGEFIHYKRCRYTLKLLTTISSRT